MALLHCLQPLQVLSRGTLWGEETQHCPGCSEMQDLSLIPDQDNQLGLAQECHDGEG